MEFAGKLKELRLQKGVSQQALADAIHISRSAVAKWENGLGLPGEASLQQLCQYFGVTEKDLLPDPQSAEVIVAKNRTITQQKNLILGLTIGAVIGLLLLGYLFIEPLRPQMQMLGVGGILIALGVFNMQGNIASIHWYQRRRVTAEDQKPYCLLMGFGTAAVGLGMIACGILQLFVPAVGEFILLFGVLIGLGAMLYAQFKYNKGLF